MTPGRSIALLLLLTVASPGVAAELKSPLAMTVDPADRAVMAEAASAMASSPPDLVRLDAVLAKLPRPTPLRGMVQTVRANALAAQDRRGEAIAAIEEGMRLLPDDPRPKMVATSILIYAGAPQRAADLWLQASRESPDLALMSDRYTMWALTGRLNDAGDAERVTRVNARLAELGFARALAPERSRMALARVRDLLAQGRMADAGDGISAVTNPDDLRLLYLDRSFAPLWPRIAEWAGPALERQQRRYLEELRADWTAADDVEAAVPYARALAGLGAYRAVVSLFLPLLERPGTDLLADDAEYLAPVVARSLGEIGRGIEARSLLDRVFARLPNRQSGADLNILGAQLNVDVATARWSDAVAKADTFLARAQQLGPGINSSAVLQVQMLRACGLRQLGRLDEAEQEAAAVLLAEKTMPSLAMQVQLCRGDATGARALLLRRLADEQTRGWALDFLQPKLLEAASPIERATWELAAAVRIDPTLRAAAAKVGRVLTVVPGGALPAGFDPFRSPPGTAPLGPDAI